MAGPTDIESLIAVAESSSRGALIEMLRSVPCPFPLDFTDAYLSDLPLERLKHLVVVVYLHSWKSVAPATSSNSAA